jgi:aspartate/methionine/tyrosine aminotransferase
MRLSPVVASVFEPPVAEVKEWVAGRTFSSDRPLVDVSQAVPGYPAAEELRSHLAAVVQLPSTGTYAPALGLSSTRAATAAHLTGAYGGRVDVEQVMITAGCNQAYCLAIGALCEPGDDVVLPIPYYFNHQMWLDANGVRAVHVVCEPSGGMQPSIAAIERAIGPRTRAIVLVTPNNPCGVVYPPSLIARVYELARAADIALVLDETYKDFRATTAPAHDLFTRADWPSTLVQLLSFSKVFSLAGYRCGAIVSSPALLHEVVKLADCETIGAPRIAQEAATFGLEHLGPWAEARRVEMVERVDAFHHVMESSHTGFRVVAAAAYFAWVRHPFGGVAARDVARRLADDHDLLAIPGECFGPLQDPYLRLAFGNVATSDMPMVASRLAAAAEAI